LEVLFVTIGSDSTLELGWTGPGSTRSCERGGKKRNHSAVQRLLIEAGNNIIFTPVVVLACGAMDPSMVAFLKEVYGRAKEADKFLMLQQPALKQALMEHDGGFVVLGYALEN